MNARRRIAAAVCRFHGNEDHPRLQGQGRGRDFVREELNNRFGMMHGGAVMALADNLGGTATFANLPKASAPRRSKARPISSPPSGRRHRARRMHAAASRPHHHGLADTHHPQRWPALRIGDANADRHSTGAILAQRRVAASRNDMTCGQLDRHRYRVVRPSATSPDCTGNGHSATPSSRRQATRAPPIAQTLNVRAHRQSTTASPYSSG